MSHAFRYRDMRERREPPAAAEPQSSVPPGIISNVFVKVRFGNLEVMEKARGFMFIFIYFYFLSRCCQIQPWVSCFHLLFKQLAPSC